MRHTHRGRLLVVYCSSLLFWSNSIVVSLHPMSIKIHVCLRLHRLLGLASPCVCVSFTVSSLSLWHYHFVLLIFREFHCVARVWVCSGSWQCRALPILIISTMWRALHKPTRWGRRSQMNDKKKKRIHEKEKKKKWFFFFCFSLVNRITVAMMVTDSSEFCVEKALEYFLSFRWRIQINSAHSHTHHTKYNLLCPHDALNAQCSAQ